MPDELMSWMMCLCFVFLCFVFRLVCLCFFFFHFYFFYCHDDDYDATLNHIVEPAFHAFRVCTVSGGMLTNQNK